MPSPGAVFLSYASQDAEAARGLAEALREAGLEAWFDQSELRGGDAWDQKIRRQIKECAIFMPLVSATTNARTEGYFRLEWKLAVDRSHLMADDAPFLFPVAIDATTEQEARVPDRFREVQWSRLDRESPESIAARVARLIAGEIAPVPKERPLERRRKPAWYLWAAIGLAFALVFALKPFLQPKKHGAAAPEKAAATPASEAASLARRAIGHTTKLNFRREDLAIGADLARRATELDPVLALAWGARARVEASWINRNWDHGEERRRAVQEFARRALALDRDEPNALWAQGMVLLLQGAPAEAAAGFERALKAAPGDNYVRGALSLAYAREGKHEQAYALKEEALRRDPRDPLNHYALALDHASAGRVKDGDPANIDKALHHLDQANRIHPVGAALAWKAMLLAAHKGDLEGARAVVTRIEALPHEEATEDRMIFTRMWIALLERKPERVLAAAASTTSTYFEDLVVPGPVAWYKAMAHRQAGRASAAAEEWRAAEVVLRARLARSPEHLPTQAELAITLAMQGRSGEARKQFARYEASMREKGQVGTPRFLRFYAAMGDGRRFAESAREMRKAMAAWTTDAVLARDPWFDRVRGTAEFKAL